MAEENWKQFIQKARENYYKIDAIPCPAFGGELIYFNKYGFNHLIWKGGEARDINEQIERIRLIPEAVEIIGNSKSFGQHRKYERNSRRGGFISVAYFWSFERKTDYGKITVIVRQTNNGLKHFFSVMNKVKSKKSKNPIKGASA